jgi:hypothetical protein
MSGNPGKDRDSSDSASYKSHSDDHHPIQWLKHKNLPQKYLLDGLPVNQPAAFGKHSGPVLGPFFHVRPGKMRKDKLPAAVKRDKYLYDHRSIR